MLLLLLLLVLEPVTRVGAAPDSDWLTSINANGDVIRGLYPGLGLYPRAAEDALERRARGRGTTFGLRGCGEGAAGASNTPLGRRAGRGVGENVGVLSLKREPRAAPVDLFDGGLPVDPVERRDPGGPRVALPRQRIVKHRRQHGTGRY